MARAFESFILGALVLLTILESTGAFFEAGIPQGCPCTDIQPAGAYTCEDQKKFGKCEREWMKVGGFCEFTCGICSCDNVPAALEDDVEKPVDQASIGPRTDEQRESGCECADIPPGDDFTCEEQKKFGKCERLWMEGYCQLTCGTCSCPSLSEGSDGTVPLAATSEKEEALTDVADGQFSDTSEDGDRERPARRERVERQQKDVDSMRDDKQGRDNNDEQTEFLGGSEPTESNLKTDDSENSTTLEDIQMLPKEIQDVLIRLDNANALENQNPAIQEPADCETVWRVIETRPDLSSLKEAIENGHLYQAISDPDLEVTLLAPNNEAFMEFKSEIGAGADELLRDPDFLQAIISYHTILPPMRLEDMEEGRMLSTLAILKDSPESLEVSTVSGSEVTIAADNGSGKTTEGNIQACKSVVHVIDTVLVSNTIEELMNSFDLDIQ